MSQCSEGSRALRHRQWGSAKTEGTGYSQKATLLTFPRPCPFSLDMFRYVHELHLNLPKEEVQSPQCPLAVGPAESSDL